MKLFKDGQLMIPLFHGTSMLFVDEIFEKGLGAIDPLQEYGIKETLEKLIQKGYEYLPKSEHGRLTFSNAMLNQTMGNHKYGGVFLSPSKITAVKYSRNYYGSEFISQTIALYYFLKDSSVPVELDNEFLNNILDSPFQPAVIMATKVQCSWLQSEISRIPIEESFNKLQSIWDDGSLDFQYFSQQTNFKLCPPHIITSDHLKVLSTQQYKNIREKYKSSFHR